ncbi:MAG: UDP-2,3-diacylglucosamine diphosphatase [Flavobacteriaceae bacterium]
MKKRRINLAVISDVHLGNVACHAEELITYLNSIQPEILILNGDIIDEKAVEKTGYPPSHIEVLNKIIGMAANGTVVYYLGGNHEMKVDKTGESPFCNFNLTDELVLEFDGKKTWFLPGDIFGSPPAYLGRLASLGDLGHTCFIFSYRIRKWILAKKAKNYPNNGHTLSRKYKERIALNFEKTLVNIAIKKGYDFVVCGHLHLPKKEIHLTKNGQCTYLNSGDWVMHLTALEYSFKRWKIYRYRHDKLSPFFADEALKAMDLQDLIVSLGTKAKKSKDSYR